MTTCDGPTCDGLAVATVTTGCIREHITTVDTCLFHLTRAEMLHAADNLWCADCGPAGQRTRVRIRVQSGDAQ